MFTVNNYRISFRKSHSLIISKNKGRYDTACTIETESTGLLYKGTAYLHPNDSPDKITGKKIALTKALIECIEIKKLPNGTKLKRIHWYMNKQIRTEIWRAFWEWVESWKINKNPTCFGEPTQESEKCNNCFCLSRCVDKLWGEPTSNPKHTIKLVNENLAFCTVCKGGEGELTTECCGRPMTEKEKHRVYEIGNLDFINGKWIDK